MIDLSPNADPFAQRVVMMRRHMRNDGFTGPKL